MRGVVSTTGPAFGDRADLLVMGGADAPPNTKLAARYPIAVRPGLQVARRSHAGSSARGRGQALASSLRLAPNRREDSGARELRTELNSIQT